MLLPETARQAPAPGAARSRPQRAAAPRERVSLAYVGIGSNLLDPAAQVKSALAELARIPAPVSSSPHRSTVRRRWGTRSSRIS